MSSWGWASVFGGSAAKSKDTPKNAILNLRCTLGMLAKQEKQLQNQMDEQDAKARKNVTANKGGGCHASMAKAALRRKKHYEHQLELTSAQMLTIEREVSSIETANLNKESFNAMKQAQQAMKTIHGGLAIDKVDQTMEDLRELHANGEEVSEALAQGNVGQGVDEKEPDERLAEL
ncbi:ESCRT-III subunit protein snf7 [Friedmanniomyces endolithicus]|uniref:Vacuolar-sorting protein SNF7 n=1 Tax=Friedmanniomyces endolithicus TaxID=329885 RepID=A0AAN6IZF7_9PEZI|nr:ESCRT-III subunit protein snf7 [Friedmanniomyces endolithicus]KAK0267601.1 ESCRT-III subunit protein snf7 [Friedmanniomyces endolithicus]KAK0302791.1 ESCRT-III subunit protein snf7 [Friedmanniomyces endolithicus]KAK0971367.1 ESCRT-III subunit protein snf7 [Friedmanniomyces endolithicus]